MNNKSIIDVFVEGARKGFKGWIYNLSATAPRQPN